MTSAIPVRCSTNCTGRYELNKLTSLPMCGFIAQLVEHRTASVFVEATVFESRSVKGLIIFQASSFQLPKLKNLLPWSFFTFIFFVSLKKDKKCFTPLICLKLPYNSRKSDRTKTVWGVVSGSFFTFIFFLIVDKKEKCSTPLVCLKLSHSRRKSDRMKPSEDHWRMGSL